MVSFESVVNVKTMLVLRSKVNACALGCMAGSLMKARRKEQKQGWMNLLGQAQASLEACLEAGAGQANAGRQQLGRERFSLCSLCLSQCYKFRSCLDPETVCRPEGTAAASRRDGKRGEMDPLW